MARIFHLHLKGNLIWKLGGKNCEIVSDALKDQKNENERHYKIICLENVAGLN